MTISINAPNEAMDQELLTLDLPPGLTIADLKGFVNAETQLPQASQQFYLNGQPIQGDTKTLEEAGIKDGEMIAMLVRQPQPQAASNNMGTQRTQQRSGGGGGGRAARQPGPDEIETMRLSILGNPAAMANMRSQQPDLADAINDSGRFRDVFQTMVRQDEDRERERMNQMRLLNEDPFNVEAQRKIEEMIRQESVQENLQHAYEHNPEGRNRQYTPFTADANLCLCSLRSRDHAIYSMSGEQDPSQGLCRFRRTNHHHVSKLCGGLRHHASYRQALQRHRQGCRHCPDPRARA